MSSQILFSQKDKDQILKRGNTLDQITNQLTDFKNGYAHVILKEAATLENGIFQLSETEKTLYEKLYSNFNGSTCKFIPASGAATRMFKALYAFKESPEKKLTQESNPEVFNFFKSLDSFAFYEDLCLRFEKIHGVKLEEAQLKGSFATIIEVLLSKKGLNYGSLPKGLIKFHKYESELRTPIEEQLVEGENHALAPNSMNFHFTVSPEYMDHFRSLIESNSISSKYKKFHLSIQNPATDTIAVDLSNQPFRDKAGNLVFRPAGHGALLENLNEIDEDLVFVKNIDNVLPDNSREDTIRYKRILGGVLLHFQEKIHDLLRKNDENHDIEPEGRALLEQLGERGSLSKQKIIEKLNRPLRICGMVKNEGEPGGGPFWIQKENDLESLQIIESAQVDFSNTAQAAIFKESTHFNPVDLVCGLKDYKGEKYDLLRYRDDKMGFITEKSFGKNKLKAMELPGLWNGAMADWNTIFVEVPLSTFSPVKTINDLLRPEHQA